MGEVIHHNIFFLVDEGSYGLPLGAARKGCLSNLMTFAHTFPLEYSQPYWMGGSGQGSSLDIGYESPEHKQHGRVGSLSIQLPYCGEER